MRLSSKATASAETPVSTCTVRGSQTVTFRAAEKGTYLKPNQPAVPTMRQSRVVISASRKESAKMPR